MKSFPTDYFPGPKVQITFTIQQMHNIQMNTFKGPRKSPTQTFFLFGSRSKDISSMWQTWVSGMALSVIW